MYCHGRSDVELACVLCKYSAGDVCLWVNFQRPKVEWRRILLSDGGTRTDKKP